MKSAHMHTGLAATLPWLVHHYVPTIHLPSTSGNILHCHIWTCLSNHVSHCLEEFSPQTSPSGISYPMVGVPSMCPPPPFTLLQTSTLHPHPHSLSAPPLPASLPPPRPSIPPLARPLHHPPPPLPPPLLLSCPS